LFARHAASAVPTSGPTLRPRGWVRTHGEPQAPLRSGRVILTNPWPAAVNLLW
jgi:hypothetical protein